MKRHFFSLLTVFLTALLLSSCGHSGYAGPEKAVRCELDLIQNMDEGAIQTFLSTEGLSFSSDTDILEATKLFFKNFRYDIVSSRQEKDGTTATVKASITNIDAKVLATDLCKKMIQTTSYDSGNYDLSDYFALMKGCLTEKEYPVRTTEATFLLTYDQDVWTIQPTPTLADELVGGLVHYLNDSYLLSPDEVLDLALDPFRDFHADEWSSYLNIDNIFSLNTSNYKDLDLLLASKLASCYDYKILDTRFDGDIAYVDVNITGVDLSAVLEDSRKDLLEYAHTPESVRATDEEIAEKSVAILEASLEENGNSVDSKITIQLNHTDYSWDVILDDVFASALLGNPDISSIFHTVS